MMRDRWITTGCALIFFASGFPALAYQVIWQRMLTSSSGIHLASVTLILTAFLTGLGIGNLVGGRIADQIGQQRSLLGFALCELTLAPLAWLSPWLYHSLPMAWLGEPAGHRWVLPLLQFGLLLPPTFLVGASLPLLVRSLVARLRGAARTIGVLYGVNVLGASCGAFLSAWLLIGIRGLAGTVYLAGWVNLVAGLVALVLYVARRRASKPLDSPMSATPARAATSERQGELGLPAWCLLYGLGGFMALSLEILWLRLLDVAMKPSPQSFGHVLGIFLFFLGAGSILAAFVAARLRRPDVVFLRCQWGVTAIAGTGVLFLLHGPLDLLGLGILPQTWSSPDGFQVAAEWKQALQRWPDDLARHQMARLAQVYLMQPLVLIAPATFLMGFSFPCLQRAVQTDLRRVGRRLGLLQAANLAGSILGAGLTGALLLTVLGSGGALRLVLLLGALFAIAAMRPLDRGAGRAFGPIALVVSLVLAISSPGNRELWLRLHGGDPETLVAEDASGVVVLQEATPGPVILRVNGESQSWLPYGHARTLLGIVPALLRPEARDALVVGLGSGNTAWAIGAAPDLRRIDVHEVVRAELAVLRDHASSDRAYLPLSRFLADDRVHITFVDGRRGLAGGKRYDLIEADAAEPYMVYSGHVYSREFFELVRGALRPEGVFVTYVPTDRVRRTLAAVFPHVVDLQASGHAGMAIASEDPIGFDPELLERRLLGERFQQYLKEAGEEERATRLVREYLATVIAVRLEEPVSVGDDLNTDLWPRDEFAFE